jgi:hypothetical protein
MAMELRLLSGITPGRTSGRTAASFDEARADFGQAWTLFCRNAPQPISRRGAINRHGLAEKYRRFDRGERMPPDWKPSHAAAG